MSDELNNENTSRLDNNETQNEQKDSAEHAESNNLTSIFKKVLQ